MYKNKAELLLPAGNIEKMKYAISYGADAVYFGVGDYSLRAMKSGDIITTENIKEAIDTAHSLGSKAYVTLNIFAHNEDIDNLPAFLEQLHEAKPDAIIFSDMGIYKNLKKYMPKTQLHLSTQANCTNYDSVAFYRDLGLDRVILARELSIDEIAKIHLKVPDIELEAFIHGSLCVSYSGRCLLSDYMTSNERKSNKGDCTQPCRWKYKLIEMTRPGQEFEIQEDNNGTYILNPKDIALLEYIPAMIDAGVCSLKIEGRTKSLYYASTVARAYRSAIDSYYENKKIDKENLMGELVKVANRKFSNGFITGAPDSSHYHYSDDMKNTKRAKFLATLTEHVEGNTYRAIARNQIKLNDEVEWITPTQTVKTSITSMKDEYGNDLDVANTNKELLLKLSGYDKVLENAPYGIIRAYEGN